jgi:ATP synthase protein I
MRRNGRVFLTPAPCHHYVAPRFHGFEGFAMPDRRTPDDEAAMSQKLRRLGDEISEAGARRKHQAETRQEQEAETQSRYSNLARGFQLSGEFVAGILVGGVVGWGIDYVAGSSPWGLIVCVLLGFGAGTLNVMRSAGVIARQGETWKNWDKTRDKD